MVKNINFPVDDNEYKELDDAKSKSEHKKSWKTFFLSLIRGNNQ